MVCSPDNLSTNNRTMLLSSQENARHCTHATQFLDHVLITRSTRASGTGLAIFNDQLVRCKTGRNGIKYQISEGSGMTPAGIWHMRYVLYRADRITKPKTSLPVFPIHLTDSWCDEVSKRYYNFPLGHTPKNTDEALWRADQLYDIVVVIDHNSAPAVKNRGSAIFIHTEKPENSHTLGCLAFTEKDLRRLLSRCNCNTRLIIRP